MKAEAARSVTLYANGGTTLLVGDKPVLDAKGEILIEIEHPSVKLLVPSPPKRKTVANSDAEASSGESEKDT